MELFTMGNSNLNHDCAIYGYVDMLCQFSSCCCGIFLFMRRNFNFFLFKLNSIHFRNHKRRNENHLFQSLYIIHFHSSVFFNSDCIFYVWCAKYLQQTLKYNLSMCKIILNWILWMNWILRKSLSRNMI